MGAFDEMACSCGTHPSAYTKAAIGWLDASTIALHTGRVADYTLHSVGLVQPATVRQIGGRADRFAGALSHGRSAPASRPIRR
jgi:hypothetical protein